MKTPRAATSPPEAARSLAVTFVGGLGDRLGTGGFLLDGLGTAGFVLIVIGGGLYSIGAVFYALHRPNPWPRWFGYHEIFHLFVIGGVAVHYVAIAFYAVPQAAA